MRDKTFVISHRKHPHRGELCELTGRTISTRGGKMMHQARLLNCVHGARVCFVDYADISPTKTEVKRGS